MANEIRDAFNTVFADGPTGSPSQPTKSRIRQEVGAVIQQQVDAKASSADLTAETAARVEAVTGEASSRQAADNALSDRITGIEGATAAGYKFYATKAALTADTGQADGTRAVVDQDTTLTNNGIYASTGGAWTKIGDYVPSEVAAARGNQASLDDRIDLITNTLIGISGAFSPGLMALAGKTMMWLDFADAASLAQNEAGVTAVSSDDDPIGHVRDKSGGGRHYRKASADADSVRPLYKANVLNGNSVARFDGSNDRLQGALNDLARNRSRMHLFAVVKFGSTAAERLLQFNVSSGTATRLSVLSQTASKPGVSGRDSMDVSFDTIRTGVSHTSQWIVLETMVDFTTGLVTVSINGDIEAFGTMASKGTTPDTNSSAVWLGSTTEGTQYLKGDIAEIILAADDVDLYRRQIYQYLADKWGLEYHGPQVYDPGGALPACWTWFNDPRVIKVDTDHYIVGGVQRGSDIVVSDWIGGSQSHSVLRALYEADDHDNPAFLRRASDNRIMAFYAKHKTTTVYNLRISTNADDPSAWGTEIDISGQLGHGAYSYAVAFQMASGRIYLFYRARNTTTAEWAWHMSYSDSDDGTGFTIGVQLTPPERPYLKLRQDGSKIHIICNDGHPQSLQRNSTYHFYMLDTAGAISWHKSDGTEITSPPFDQATEMTRIYDGTTYKSWVHDIVADGSGNPVAAFAVFMEPYPHVTDHRYHQARWDGSAWTDYEVCDAGGCLTPEEQYYSGGVVTDPADPDIVWCSRQVNEAGNADPDGIFQIYRYVTTDGGQNWTGTQMTFENVHCFRPYIPVGGDRVFYVKGRYDHYTDFATTIASIQI